MYPPLPKSIREENAIKLSNGILTERIMEGNHKTLSSGVWSATY